MNSDVRNMENELDALKKDYNALKDQLAQQKIINENATLDSVRGKAGYLDHANRLEYICAAIAAILSPSFHYAYGTSWYFVILTILLMISCVAVSYVMFRKVRSSNIEGRNMREYMQELKTFRTKIVNWEKIGFVLAALWMAALGYEIYSNTSDPAIAYGIIAFLLLGGITGFCIGLRIVSKVLKTCDSIIRQIEE